MSSPTPPPDRPRADPPSLPSPPDADQGTRIEGLGASLDPRSSTLDPRPSTLDELERPARRRLVLPLFLFVITCASTFLAGATRFEPIEFVSQRPQIQAAFAEDGLLAGIAAVGRALDWGGGGIYMAAVLGILLLHEMGHFLQTLRHRIAASLPHFIPFPISPIGTLGAVIAMDGRAADRKQLFDIGVSGPLAGLVLAVPLLWLGIGQLEPVPSAQVKGLRFQTPLLVDLLAPYVNPQFAEKSDGFVALADLNPLYMAGWVGLLITGLNMMPVSQLDGGHVVYALFPDRAHTIAGAFVVVAIGYIVNTDHYTWTLMLLLVILMGIHHPSTRDDRVRLGPVRWAIGLASLSIPFLCFPPRGFILD